MVARWFNFIPKNPYLGSTYEGLGKENYARFYDHF
jgi:hypothetical protein